MKVPIIVAAALAVLAVLVAVLLALGVNLLWWLTAIFHAFKRDELPGKNDSHWTRDQGREAR